MTFSDAITNRLKLNLSDDNSRIVISSADASSKAEVEYSFGIEEEYFLVDRHTLDVAHSTPDDFFAAATWATGGQAMREMLQAQLEVVTNTHVDIRDAREELMFLRQEASTVAAQFGLAIMASGTHPTASWRQSKLSPKARYERMIEDLRVVGRRNMLCGMHVHVGLPDPDRRLRVMRALIPYIPVFIALSTSSPYWNGEATGLKGYRLAAYDELPRTGIPELFNDQTEYRSYVDALTRSGAIPDESYIWWAMRSSARHPTLELRATDCCTKLDDAIAIASLYRALARYMDRQPDSTTHVSAVDRSIAVENKWRAQRYGVSCSFASKDGPKPFSTVVRDLVDLVRRDTAALRCESEAQHCNLIVRRGSSADHQLSFEDDHRLASAKQWIAKATVGAENKEDR
jgi:carboxylate-amine ligase